MAHKERLGLVCGYERAAYPTVDNKRNPDPTNWVGSGNRTIDEMSIAHIDFIYLSDEDYAAEVPVRQAPLRN